MKWPARVQQIVDAITEREPEKSQYTAPDDDRRFVTKQIAEQCRFELGPNWGWKRSKPGYPLSTDVFCTREPFVGWDWSVPSGIARFPESKDLAGQVFEAVVPVDHLGTVPPAPPPNPIPEPPPIPPPDDLQARVLQLEAEIRLHEAIQRDLYRWIATKVNEPLPDYEGTGTGSFRLGPWTRSVTITVRSKPEP